MVYFSFSVFWRGHNTKYLCFEGQTGSDRYDKAKTDTEEGLLDTRGVLRAAGQLPRVQSLAHQADTDHTYFHICYLQFSTLRGIQGASSLNPPCATKVGCGQPTYITGRNQKLLFMVDQPHNP